MSFDAGVCESSLCDLLKAFSDRRYGVPWLRRNRVWIAQRLEAINAVAHNFECFDLIVESVGAIVEHLERIWKTEKPLHIAWASVRFDCFMLLAKLRQAMRPDFDWWSTLSLMRRTGVTAVAVSYVTKGGYHECVLRLENGSLFRTKIPTPGAIICEAPDVCNVISLFSRQPSRFSEVCASARS